MYDDEEEEEEEEEGEGDRQREKGDKDCCREVGQGREWGGEEDLN